MVSPFSVCFAHILYSTVKRVPERAGTFSKTQRHRLGKKTKTMNPIMPCFMDFDEVDQTDSSSRISRFGSSSVRYFSAKMKTKQGDCTSGSLGFLLWPVTKVEMWSAEGLNQLKKALIRRE